VYVCASLRDKQVIDYKRRGYGGSNLYRFLDPTIEMMINRLLSEPASVPSAEPESQLPQTKPETPPIESNGAHAPELPLVGQIVEPIATVTVEAGGELEPSEPAEPIRPVADLPQVEQINEQIEPVSPMGSISANPAQLSRANSAHLMKKNTQPEKDPVKEKDTHSQARKRACVPKSKFPLSICIAFAATLRAEGIANPWGYGTAIWRDGREDGRITEFEAGGQTDPLLSPPSSRSCGHCWEGVIAVVNDAGQVVDARACACARVRAS
jgi:hypothetical protein